MPVQKFGSAIGPDGRTTPGTSIIVLNSDGSIAGQIVANGTSLAFKDLNGVTRYEMRVANSQQVAITGTKALQPGFYIEASDGGNAVFRLAGGAGDSLQFGGNGSLSLLQFGPSATTAPELTVSTSTLTLSTALKLACDSTDNSGTPGATTINKASGKCAIAIGAASVVVTNSLVTAASIVLCVLQFTDATLTFIKSVIPAAGSFTITGNANATAATKVGFVVFN